MLLKIIKYIGIAIFIFGLLYLGAGRFLGPGVTDTTISIINGYSYSDAGGYEKTIFYGGKERVQEIIIDARVDDYRVDGNNIVVARRPRISQLEKDNSFSSNLLPDCEYLVIDTKKHTTIKSNESLGVKCNE